jgi:hypothetical protein
MPATCERPARCQRQPSLDRDKISRSQPSEALVSRQAIDQLQRLVEDVEWWAQDLPTPSDSGGNVEDCMWIAADKISDLTDEITTVLRGIQIREDLKAIK